MKTEEIRRIEAAVGVSLPAHYVELLTNYPNELLETDAPNFFLLNNPEAVIEENLSVRGKPFYGGIWPDHFFIIGTNGCGDLYVTKLNAKEFTIGFFDHEASAFIPYSSSKIEFISKVLQESNHAGT